MVQNNGKLNSKQTVCGEKREYSKESRRKQPNQTMWTGSKIVFALTVFTSLAAVLLAISLASLGPNSPYKNHHSFLSSNSFLSLIKRALFFPSSHEQHHYSGAVSADVEKCSEIGVSMFAKGGGGVDAAVAALLCLGVINSFHSGLGGGGLMLVSSPPLEIDNEHSAGLLKRRVEVIDFRETAPQEAHRDVYKRNSSESIYGAKSIAVPGELRGMEMAHGKYGKLPWKELFEPAIELCEKGFAVPWKLARTLVEYREAVERSEELQRLFMVEDEEREGEIVRKKGLRMKKEGEFVFRPLLGKTLRLIAEKGADEFYKGSLGKRLVMEIQKMGGIVTEKDFHDYRAILRETVSTSFRGYRLHSAPAPASGHILQLVINILEEDDFGSLLESDYGSDTDRYVENAATFYHRVVESFKLAFAKRSHLADPEYANISSILEVLHSKEHAKEFRRMVVDGKTFDPSYYGPHYDMEPTPGTTHVSVVGPDGVSVSLTSTINHYWGSGVVSGEGGFIFNNQMNDFSLPGVTNYFGVAPSANNYIAPGKRPMSSAAPSMLVNEKNGDGGHVSLVIGASGGTLITTATALTLMKIVAFNMTLEEAIKSPRLHHQLLPNKLFLEKEFDARIADRLKSFGHEIDFDMKASIVQAVGNFKGTMTAFSDERKKGKAKLFE